MNDKIYPSMVIRSQAEAIELLEKENKQLNKQLEYLRSGEYLNQLKFERNMLEDIIQDKELSDEVYSMKEMTKANTKLCEKLELSESVIKEIREYIQKNKLYTYKYDEEELFEITTDEVAKTDLLQILDKVKD